MDQYPTRPESSDPKFPEESFDGPDRFMNHREMEEFLSSWGTRKERKAIKAYRETEVGEGRREPRRWRSIAILTVGVATVIALLVLMALVCQLPAKGFIR